MSDHASQEAELLDLLRGDFLDHWQHPGQIDAVHAAGKYPETRIVVTGRRAGGSAFRIAYPIWKPDGKSTLPDGRLSLTGAAGMIEVAVLEA